MADLTSSGVDMSQFQAAMREYLAATEKALPDALNSKMFYIARGASRGTPKADRSEIEHSMGVIGYKISASRKDGKLKRRKSILRPLSRAAKIVLARLRRAGKPGLSGRELERAAQKMIGKRIRAVGTEKAGWLNIIRGFAAIIGESVSEFGRTVKGRGSIVPAKIGWSPRCSFDYNLNSYDTNHVQHIDPRTVASLQSSFNAEAFSMREHLRKRLQPIADAHNGRAK